MSHTSKILRGALIGASALTLCATATNAAGFYIQEQSVSGFGSAFSGAVTNLNDASTIYFNPAGLSKLDRTQVNLGVHLLVPDSEMQDRGSTRTILAPGATVVSSGGSNGGNPYDPTPVPNGFVARPLNDKWAIGIGFTAPFGLGGEYDRGWFGRFDSTKSELTLMDVQPTMSYRANDRLSFGLGVNVGHADADLQNNVSNAASEGLQILKGDDWGYGYTLGMQYKLTPATTFGANYKSSMHFDLEGRASVSGLTAGNFDRPANAALVTPDIASFGLSHKLNDRWTVQGQANWFGWNNFDAITVVFTDNNTVAAPVRQNYQTTWAYALGGEYKYSDAWTWRAGVQFDETPTTDEFRTSRTPDGDRTWITGGATWNMSKNWAIDFAAGYIDIADENMNVTRGVTTVRADTEGSVGIFSLGLNYKF